ncbi:MAG: cysteine methyltransferase [Phycisphaerales bacterium]|nr:cysteine methyltransferase [Phycisphaerales bacterium]
MPTTKTTTLTTKPELEILAGRIVKGMSFNEQVWAVCARVPKGKVTTYASIARKLGTQAYRAVGNAMNKNPYAPRVPCHRVVGSDGSLTGFAQGLEKKKRLLKAEGVPFVNGKVDLQQSAAEL